MASSKKANAKDKDVKPLSDAALRHNAAALEYCRTSVSAVSGSTAGIMGLTGFYGFAFYFITALMMSCMLFLKTGHWNRYFISPYILVTGGLLGGLLTYLLCWTFLYGMVHVY